jgi:hypothetical protein
MTTLVIRMKLDIDQSKHKDPVSIVDATKRWLEAGVSRSMLNPALGSVEEAIAEGLARAGVFADENSDFEIEVEP